MPSPAYEIPLDLHARALALYKQGHSARQVWLALWPAPETPPVSQATFANALIKLDYYYTEQYRELCKREGIPVVATGKSISQGEVVRLALMPAVQDQPLPPEIQEGMTYLRQTLGALLTELQRAMEDPLPDPVGQVLRILESKAAKDLSDEDRQALIMVACKQVAKGNDQRVVRSGAVVALANAVAGNVATAIRGMEAQLNRTIGLFNLRLANKREVEDEERQIGRADRDAEATTSSSSTAPAPLFAIDLSGNG